MQGGRNDEGTFTAQCGPWHKMDIKLVDIQNGRPDLFDEEDGDEQQIGREVLRTVGEGTQHGWSKLVGLMSSHVQEEACARSEASKGASEGKENKKGTSER